MNSGQNELSPEETFVVGRTEEIVDGCAPESLLEDEKHAMRAFLQRGETRLSTYQRVAGVFLNGRGLLVLLPGTGTRVSLQHYIVWAKPFLSVGLPTFGPFCVLHHTAIVCFCSTTARWRQ